uniref:Uncharacterized protein n=1 Tax=Oncorhynchus tshawytscha TaxID=74940 RepID=A0AAZ3P324_ONCTS
REKKNDTTRLAKLDDYHGKQCLSNAGAGQRWFAIITSTATRRAKSEDRNSNEDVSNAHNRRELPSRRQAYRKVSSDPAGPKVEEIKEEVAPCSVPPGPGMPASIYQTNHGQFIAFTQDGAIQLTSALPRGLQALQPLTMSNSGNSQSAAAIVQYSQQSGDGTQQFYMQGNKGMVKGKCSRPSPSRSAINWIRLAY